MIEISDIIYSSNSDEWGTPQDKFNEWDKEFKFTLDPCCNIYRQLKHDWRQHAKLDYIDGLSLEWKNQRVYVNPPYSNKNVELWCKKCFDEKDQAELIVLLIPLSKGSTKYFHKYVYPYAEIRMLENRLKFVPLDGQKQSSNPMGSMLCIFKRS